MPLENLNMAGCGAEYDEDGDLSGSKITGGHGASGQQPKNLPRNLLHFLSRHVHFPSTPLTPGDIAVFKDMALTSLDLYGTRNLTGES